ncbi:MAG TPA: DUF2884 family protein [Steroidobacteraceae bacterium]|nr:DUF2884 family protein [Steroidobacteraceae bacterium]
MRFMRTMTFVAAATCVAVLAACGHSKPAPAAGPHSGSLRVEDGQVVIAGAGGGEARVSPDGRLTVGGADVSVTEGQRAQLANYYKAASAVFDHAVATGSAGAAVGAAAASGVASGLAKGDMSDLKAKVEAQAGEVRRQAAKMCESLKEARAAQDALAAQLPAFQPYAVISEKETADCARDLQRGPST